METPRKPGSLLRYSPALVVVAIAIADLQRWADPDLWGHVAFGRAMLASHHLALRDTYSYSAQGHRWLNHEWLSELMMGAIYNAFGVIGLKLLKFGCSSAVIVFLTLALAETGAPTTIQFAILLAAGVAIAPQMQFRPQLFTFALMTGLIALIARYRKQGFAPLCIAIPMLALWANLHGGFIIGLLALGTFSIAVSIEDFFQGCGMKRGLGLFAILISSTLATLMTPYGFGTWEAVAHAMMNPLTREVIDDWQPLLRALIAMWHRNHGGAIPMIVACAMFLALGCGFALAPNRDDLPMLAIALVMIAGEFVAMRNLPIAVIATVVPLGRQLSSFPHDSWLSRAVREPPLPEQERRSALVHQIVVGIVAIILLVITGLLSPMLRAGSPRPVGAIGFMQEHRLQGNILADFAWGEYVIWQMAPGSKVFIDGRYDTVYPPEVIDDYLAFHYGGPRAAEVLRKYPHDFILLSLNDEAAVELIAASPQWKRIYRDANCLLFVRAGSGAAQIPPVDVEVEHIPASYFP